MQSPGYGGGSNRESKARQREMRCGMNLEEAYIYIKYYFRQPEVIADSAYTLPYWGYLLNYHYVLQN